MSAHAPTHAAEAKPHISNRTYLIVFAWLAVMTAIEVAVAALPIAEPVQVIVLVVLAVIKAALVVLFYMHLRYDSKWYWITLLVPVFFVLLLGRYIILVSESIILH
jgi:cytochrome c oxidase subunit IV